MVGLLQQYIDPGTGSMLFAIVIGIAGAVSYVIRSAIVKMRFLVSGGKDKGAVASDTASIVLHSENRRYWAIFEPLVREFSRRGIDIAYLAADPDDAGLTCGLPHVQAQFIGTGNKAYAKLNMLRAVILVSTTPGLDVYQWKRSREVEYYVHLQHTIGEITTYRMFGLDYYDAILVGGARQCEDVRFLEQLRNLPPKELPLGGVPYMDEMLRRIEGANAGNAAGARAMARDAQRAAQRASAFPKPGERMALGSGGAGAFADSAAAPTVLLAPSWGPAAILSRFGGKIIDELLATGYHVIVRPHPQSFQSETELMEKLMHAYPESSQLEWNRDTDNFDCLNRADVMISDFSGVILEFALGFDKPVIYTNPNFDVSVYDSWWLDRPIWTLGALPRIGMQLDDGADVRSLIDTCLHDAGFAEGRREVREECWQGRGQGAELCVDYLLAKYAELTRTPAGEGLDGGAA